MNYNSVQEILDAGTSNMEVIRNNVKNDGGVDELVGVNWFTFNGTTASSIYVSGDSWIGFGSSTMHLKVNQRDAASWYVYREEGTLLGYYKFLKIRWRGYSRYNRTDTAYLIEYDVIMWDTGDISLHMINIPTSYNTGVYALVDSETHSYTVSVDSPDITFKFDDRLDTLSYYTVANELLDLLPPFDRKWLVKSQGKFYSTQNDVLTEIKVTSLTSTVFQEYGTDTIKWELIKDLINPEVFYWYNNVGYEFSKPSITAKMTATPLPQTIISNGIDLTNETITGIESATVVCEGDVAFAVSFDDKQTWRVWNGEQWSVVSEEFSGMTKELFESITYDNWLPLYTGATSFYIKVILKSLDQYVTQIYIDFAN